MKFMCIHGGEYSWCLLYSRGFLNNKGTRRSSPEPTKEASSRGSTRTKTFLWLGRWYERLRNIAKLVDNRKEVAYQIRLPQSSLKGEGHLQNRFTLPCGSRRIMRIYEECLPDLVTVILELRCWRGNFVQSYKVLGREVDVEAWTLFCTPCHGRKFSILLLSQILFSLDVLI